VGQQHPSDCQTNEGSASAPKKKAWYSLCLAGIAWSFMVFAVVYFVLAMPRGSVSGEVFDATLQHVEKVIAVFGFCCNLTSLAGIGFAILGTVKREWGFVLVLAWMLNLIGLLAAPFTFMFFE
jgi:hypothetical protein